MSSFGGLLALVAGHPLLARLGVASLELLACSSLLALLLSVWRPSSRRLTALLWLVVLLKPVVSLVIGDPIALFRFEAAPRVAAAAPSAMPIVERVATPASLATVATPQDVAVGSFAQSTESAAATSPTRGVAPLSPRGDSRPLDPSVWILGAWILGASALLVRRLVMERWLRRVVATAVAAPASFLRRHEALARDARLRRIPALRVTDALESPALFGTLRPLVLLPRWMVERGLDRTVEAALRHELAHCRWSDPLALLVRDAASILFFFHPAAWWAGRRLVESIELACDRDCVREPADAALYAESLYEILRRIRARRAVACARGLLGFATPGRMARRIASLVDGRPMRPLTRGAAAAAALVAVALLATGFKFAPQEAAAPKRREQPDVFLLGTLSGDAFKAFSSSARGRIGSLWGRQHDPKVYDDLFENPGHPFNLKQDDVLVVLLTSDAKCPVPEKYRDLIPQPWETISATLKKGGTVELEHAAHGLDVVVLGAKDSSALEDLLAKSAKLAALRSGAAEPASLHRGNPNVFLIGSTSIDMWETFSEQTRGRVYNLWGRPHDPKVYEDLFDNPKRPFHMEPRDVLVLMLTPDGQDTVPEKYRDLLPQPWATIVATLEKGGTVELEQAARDLDVVVLGAGDHAALEHLVLTSAKLASLRNSDGPTAATKLPAGTRYVVTIDANDRRTAAVHVELTGADSRIRFGMTSGARHLDGGYGHFLGGLKAAGRDGKAIGVDETTEPGRFSATLDRPATIDYHVALQHDASSWPEGGPDEAPYATANDVFWTGRALFLGADFDGAEVEFRLPKGWHLSTPWEPVAGRENVFRVKSFEDLTEAFILAGSHEQLMAKCGGTQVLVAVGADLGKGGKSLHDSVQRLLDAGAALFGGTPPGRKLLVANRGSWSGFNGGVFGQSISLLSDKGFDPDGGDRWFPFVAHEIVHLWNGGGGGMRSRNHDSWFSEGFTEYEAWVLSARLGSVTRDDFLERVRSACKAYASEAGTSSLREAHSRALQYDGGFLVAFCLDLRLRVDKPDGKGLDDLMREMFRRHGATNLPYGSSDIAAVAASLAGKDLDGFFERFVDGTERLPLEKEFAAARLDLHIEENATLLARDYAIHDVLRIQSLTQNESGLLVRKSKEAGYQDGDLLTAIDGTPVKSFGDLQRVLVGKDPGRELTLTLRRGERDETLRLLAGGHGDAPKERAAVVRLELKPGGEASLLDQILGRILAR